MIVKNTMKTAQFEAIIAAVFLIFGTIHSFVQSAPTEQDSSLQNIQNGIGKFNKLFVKLINDDLKPEQNALFSPLNIYTALSLLHLGTNGETRTELSNALGIPADEAELAATHNQLGKIINDLQTTDAAEVKIANSAFVQKGLQLKQSYLQATKKYYQNEAQQVDFASGSEATNTVNNWVSSNTKNRIPKLFKTAISPETQLLLASVLFFNATWQKSFQKSNTKNEKFNTGVKQIEVPTMNHKDDIPYIKNDDLQIEAISLPYKKREFSMAIVLPYQKSSVKSFVDNFKPEHLQQAIHEFSSKSEYVDYKLPRLKFGWSQSINNQLIKSGITKIFGKAELDNMVENDAKLRVSDVNHATEIQVDEDGTIATAVTTIQLTRYSLQLRPEPIKFYVNRPFLISIYHQKTGISLFTGIVQNPLAA